MTELTPEVTDRMAALEAAGFPIHYVERAEVTPDGYASPHSLNRLGGSGDAYADLGSIGRGDDTAGQASTADRSNYRALIREYPDSFTPFGYTNVNALGAFVADLTDELASILTGLRELYPVYDEFDLSDLESDEITGSWGEYVQSEIASELRDSPDEGDAWDALSAGDQESMFWRVVSDLEIYPEHDGHDIHWSDHYLAIASEIYKRLH